MKNRTSKQSKACDISRKVKQKVYERDHKCCIICFSNKGLPNAHFISRAKGGLGIEQNIVTLCPSCHALYDGKLRKEYYTLIHNYLKVRYPNLNIEELRYKNKWE